jgi:hypothetical protein
VGEALARTSRSKIAAGVRGNNWSEGRLKCRWTNSWRSYREFKTRPATKDENLVSSVSRLGTNWNAKITRTETSKTAPSKSKGAPPNPTFALRFRQ